MRLAILLIALLLTACARAPEPQLAGANAFAQRETAPQRAAAPLQTQTLKVALLAPVGVAADAKEGSSDGLGLMLERAARLAIEDMTAPFELDVIDTGTGTPGMIDAARAAVDGGAKLVVGPIYAADVATASAITLPAGVPMLAFTSDTAQAAGGVYTNSFTPEAGVRAILRHAASLGTRHVVVFAPKGRYGDIALATAKKTMGRLGGQVAYAVRTDGTAEGYLQAARIAAVAVEGADAIYIPEGGKAPRAIMGELARAGVRLDGKRVLGSGQWGAADLKDPRLNGALYASNDEEAYKTFAYRYEAAHASKPTVTAALAYDAVAIAVALARRSPGRPWSRAAIESTAGFRGATGLFRFKSDGTIERRLAIREVRDGTSQQVKAANDRFQADNTRYVLSGAGLATLRR